MRVMVLTARRFASKKNENIFWPMQTQTLYSVNHKTTRLCFYALQQFALPFHFHGSILEQTDRKEIKKK